MARCNHAWPFKIACGQWLALCWVLCLQATLPGMSCHGDQDEAHMLPAALPNFIVILSVFTTVWYDLTLCIQHSRPFLMWPALSTNKQRWGMSSLSDADSGCQFLLFLFTSAHTTHCSFKWPDIFASWWKASYFCPTLRVKIHIWSNFLERILDYISHDKYFYFNDVHQVIYIETTVPWQELGFNLWGQEVFSADASVKGIKSGSLMREDSLSLNINIDVTCFR